MFFGLFIELCRTLAQDIGRALGYGAHINRG